MTKQERLDVLAELTGRLDKIIELLENKNKSCDIQFTKANATADDTELKSYEMEFFQMLDKSKGK